MRNLLWLSLLLTALLLAIAPSTALALLPECYTRRSELDTFLVRLDSLDTALGLNVVHVDTIGRSRGDMFDTTYPLYAVTVSRNPAVLEDEPVALIIGQVHAEEVMGYEMTLRFLWDLVSRHSLYGTLFDNTRLVFVPTMNPDGLEVVSRGLDDTYRKNGYHPVEMGGRPCNIAVGPGGDSCGVDLNRNFDFNWIYGDTLWRPARVGYEEAYDYYRGPAPFSEPEARAVRNLALQIHPTVSVVYHGSRTGNNAEAGIVAWSWSGNGTSRLSPDADEIYLLNRAYCNLLQKHGEGHVAYDPVFGGGRNGNLQDWFYRELGCVQINTELGPPEDIQPTNCDSLARYNQNDVESLKWLCRRLINWHQSDTETGFSPLRIHTTDAVTRLPISAEWRIAETWTPVLAPWTTDELFGSTTTLLVQGTKHIVLRKEGYATDTVAVTVSPDTYTHFLDVSLQPLPRHTLLVWLIDESGATLPGRIYLGGEYPKRVDVPAGNAAISVPEGDYQLIAVANAPDRLMLWRSVHIAGAHSEWFTLPSTTPAFRADFNNGLAGWTIGGTGNAWRAATDTSTQNTGGTLTTEPTVSLFQDAGQYLNNLNTWAQCDSALAVGPGNTAVLSFWRRGRMDIPADSLLVEVSADAGSTWQQAGGFSDFELPWTQSYVNLSAWAHQTIRLRFRFISDSVLGDLGIHIDNVTLYSGTDTAAPEHPAGPVYSYRITGAYPNPFNPSTTITYEAGRAGQRHVPGL